VRRFGKEIVSGAADLPILERCVWTGRNSAWLPYLRGHITAIDTDLDGIKENTAVNTCNAKRTPYSQEENWVYTELKYD
jgi:hypothetical protein